jgi:cyclic-di-AMP phosphodiesterase PgpH
MADTFINKLENSKRIKVIIALVTIILIVMMFPKGESIESEVSVGSIWTNDDLIAPFSFPVNKDPKVYNAELLAAKESIYPVFIKDEERIKNISDSLKNYDNYLLKMIDSSLKTSETQNINPTFLTTASFTTFVNLRRQERNMLAKQNQSLSKLFSTAEKILQDFYKKGIIDKNPDQISKDSIAVRMGNVDRIESVNKFLSLENTKDEVIENIKNWNFPDNIESALMEYSIHFVEPDIIYSDKLTNEEIEQAEKNVSRYSGIVTENERIIAKHDRITKEAKLKIDSYKQAKGEKIGSEGYLLQFFGKFLHISFLISLFSIYLFLFRQKIFQSNQKIILISIIFVFISFITYLINQIIAPSPLQLLIVIPSAAMLLTIIFDSRVGFYSMVILALITGALRGNEYTFTAMNIFAGGLAVYTVRDIKNRSQIFRSFLYILLGYTVSILAFGFERFASTETLLIEFAFACSNSLISPVLTYGLLIFFERFFKITTDLTLLELSNFDRPLLRDLARIAPGTFNHSMTVGTLAEAAAERINANPLLARVGAYYHDIGKTITPKNFVENQLNNQNIHENLTPEESVELISRHVKEGVELAKENDLPDDIIDFIPMHHGANTMTFFYEKAKERYGEEKVDIKDYQYPGPKPNSKETAIVMLADGCESAVRAVDDPDPVKVENVIDKIIKARVDDGQLDESPLTFSDLNKIKEAFLSILVGQHHRRIRYPKQDEMEKGIDEEDKKNG